MTQNDWKTGFDAGVDFVLTFANDQIGYEFKNIGEMMLEIDRLKTIDRLYEAQINAKESA
jgi:hypothetical protein